MHTTQLYFESHVTIEPVFDNKLVEIRRLAANHNFRVANLIMKKGPNETPSPNQEDTFCTGTSTNYQNLYAATKELIINLKKAGFKVYRYKIENTLIDSRKKDLMELLGD